jgi:glucose-6-phosphate dehydrogenase assembly protein OpcA
MTGAPDAPTGDSPMSVSPETNGSGLARRETAANSRAIEGALHDLWRQAEAGEIGGSLVRAASLTLIVPATSSQAAEDLIGIIDRVTMTHPCRAILIELSDSATEAKAFLTSHYRRPGEIDPARYWEEVHILAPTRGVHQAMSAASTIVLPGLPVQTWWPGVVPFDGDLYNHVVEISDRLLLNSARFRDPRAGLAELAAAIDIAHESVAFTDLSWSRISPWRVLTAELFDAPADQDLLDSIEKVVVEYSRSADGVESVEALLYIGWIASRLGWEPRAALEEAPGRWRFWLVDGVRPVEVRISRNDRPLEAGAPLIPGLRSITIGAGEGDRHASYVVERVGAGDEARTMKHDGTELEGRAHLPYPEEVELLENELGGFTTDRIYVESLRIVTGLFQEGRQ